MRALLALCIAPLIWWAEMALWNYVMPDLGLPRLGYWKIACLDLLIGALRVRLRPQEVKVVDD